MTTDQTRPAVRRRGRPSTTTSPTRRAATTNPIAAGTNRQRGRPAAREETGPAGPIPDPASAREAAARHVPGDDVLAHLDRAWRGVVIAANWFILLKKGGPEIAERIEEAAQRLSVKLHRNRGDERADLAQALERFRASIADARDAVREAASCLDTQATPATERISANLEADLVRLSGLLSFPDHVDATDLGPLLERLRLARDHLVPVMLAWRRPAPASWFQEQFGIDPDRLRSAARRGLLKARKVGREWHYSVIGARKLWPQDVTHPPI